MSQREAGARPAAILLDFHNTLAVPGSLDAWIQQALERSPGAEAVPTADRLGSVWAEARRLFPEQDGDLDPALHRRAFVSALSHDGTTSVGLAEALYATMPDQWVLNDGAAAFVARAAAAGIPLAVLSNIALDVRPALERWGIAQHLSAVLLSSEVGYVKPDPRIFRLAADALGVPAAECLMIGDSAHDDGGAAAVGMTCLIARPERIGVAFALACPP